MNMQWTLFIAIILVLSNAQGSQSDVSKAPGIPRTSICQALSHPERFNWTLVEIHATYGGTWEGAWVSDSGCEALLGEIVPPFQRGMDKSYDNVVRRVSTKYGITDVIRDKGWEQFEYASKRLFTGAAYTRADGTVERGKYDYIAADFTGVLVVKRGFRIRNGFGNGWGHLGMSRFLLVLRSVSNVAPHPCACPPEDDSSH